MSSSKTFYSHLICSEFQDFYDKKELHTFSKKSRPLLAQYDLKNSFPKEKLSSRQMDMWRYRELLPVEKDENIVTLGEGGTPLWSLELAAKKLGQQQLFLKDEAFNPTGSFKARGLGMAISKAKEFGVQKCVIPTAGNAGGAMSAYCAKAGIEAIVYMPIETPILFQKECQFFGARVELVDENIRDCAHKIKEDKESDWFDISTLKEPFRLEGKKTMGYEIAEQLGWRVPDVIIYPTGGGTGLIGIWKAFEELEKLGWIDSKRPRMVAVQSEVCCPIVQAFHQNKKYAAVFENPGRSIANGLRVPSAFGDRLILNTLYESNGAALAVSEEDIMKNIRELATMEGKLLAPEGAATWGVYKKLRKDGWIKAEEEVVLLNTGSAYKYMENLSF